MKTDQQTEPHGRRILHTLASLSFTIWLVGFFGYQLVGWYFSFLAFAVITTLLMVRMKKKVKSLTGTQL
jgi:hypothetical protein